MPPHVFWTDASHYDVGDGIAAIAVVDLSGKVWAGMRLHGRWKANAAEQEAIRIAMRLARRINGPVEIRSDSLNAIRSFTPRKGVRLVWGYRGENAAHPEARRIAKAAFRAEMAKEWTVDPERQPQAKQAGC